MHERIDKVLQDKGLIKANGRPNYAQAERLSGMKGTVLSKVSQRKGALSELNREKFLRTFHVNPDWFDFGQGEPYLQTQDTSRFGGSGEGTESTTTGDARQLIRTMVELENNGNYRFVPKQILDDYDLLPKTASERSQKERDKTIEALERYITGLEREIDDLRSGRMAMVTPSKQG